MNNEFTRRVQLQNLLQELLGSTNVYYQAPENLKMEYPCIRYSKTDIVSSHADNINYRNTTCYDLVVIDKKPDNPVINKILEQPMTSFDRHYVSDNLNHDVIRIFY